MKIIAKIELSNVDRWKIDFDNDYEKKEAFDKLEYEMKQAISEKCVIDCENISIELKLKIRKIKI